MLRRSFVDSEQRLTVHDLETLTPCPVLCSQMTQRTLSAFSLCQHFCSNQKGTGVQNSSLTPAAPEANPTLDVFHEGTQANSHPGACSFFPTSLFCSLSEFLHRETSTCVSGNPRMSDSCFITQGCSAGTSSQSTRAQRDGRCGAAKGPKHTNKPIDPFAPLPSKKIMIVSV